jgi:predicted metalloprotease
MDNKLSKHHGLLCNIEKLERNIERYEAKINHDIQVQNKQVDNLKVDHMKLKIKHEELDQ